MAGLWALGAPLVGGASSWVLCYEGPGPGTLGASGGPTAAVGLLVGKAVSPFR